jgi:hypothetical protein
MNAPNRGKGLDQPEKTTSKRYLATLHPSTVFQNRSEKQLASAFGFAEFAL